MSFGKSFDDSFKPAFTTSQAGTFDALKEKIKLEATKAEETKKVANNLSLITELVKDADPVIQERVATMIGDSTKSWGVDDSKALLDLTTSSIKDKMRNKNRPGVTPVPAVTFDPVSGKYMDQAGNPVTEISPTQEVRQKALPAEIYGERKAATEGAAQKYLKEPEIQYTRDLSDTRDTLGEVRVGLEELGIKDPTKYGNVVSETFDSEFGPISLPAKFNLVGQYAKDPKYTSLKNKMERSFQKFRKVITGAQASYSELQALRPLIASFQDRPNVFFEQLGSLENETDRMLGNHLDILDAVGRDTTKIRGLIKTKQTMKQDDEAKVSSLGFDPSKWEIAK